MSSSLFQNNLHYRIMQPIFEPLPYIHIRSLTYQRYIRVQLTYAYRHLSYILVLQLQGYSAVAMVTVSNQSDYYNRAIFGSNILIALQFGAVRWYSFEWVTTHSLMHLCYKYNNNHLRQCQMYFTCNFDMTLIEPYDLLNLLFQEKRKVRSRNTKTVAKTR